MSSWTYRLVRYRDGRGYAAGQPWAMTDSREEGENHHRGTRTWGRTFSLISASGRPMQYWQQVVCDRDQRWRLPKGRLLSVAVLATK
jgi:hypothetical protein